MKTLDYYMSLPYKVEITPDLETGGYIAKIPDLPGCISHTNTWGELQHMIEDAKKNWISTALEYNAIIHEPKIIVDNGGYNEPTEALFKALEEVDKNR